MKTKLFSLVMIVVLFLSACGPAFNATPSPVVYFSLIGRTDMAYDNVAYYSQRLVNGEFSMIGGLDCSAALLKADQKLVLLNSIEWMAVGGDVQDIIDPPGTSSYTTFVIPGDGRDMNLGFTLPNLRLNAIEVITASLTVGPCGFIVADGWLYEDIADLDLEYYAAEERHTKANLEGEFLINPSYIQGGFVKPVAPYSGTNWPFGVVENDLTIIEGGFPEHVVCNGVSQPAWYSVEKLPETWNVYINDSQHSSGFITRRTIGDEIPMWGTSYPPEINTIILGAGWTITDSRHHPYIIITIPDDCQITP